MTGKSRPIFQSDYHMTTKILKDFNQNYLQELDDHGILILDFKDFDQNSGDQPSRNDIFLNDI
jgi:hypothetical protein